MTGAPRSAYASSEFIQVRLEAVDVLGSWEAAGIWQRICWRAERTGTWTATVAEIAAEVHLSEHKTKAALTVIRGAGWLTAERASGRDRTLCWTPVWLEVESDQPRVEIHQNLEVDFDVTSSQTVETTKTPPVAPHDEEVFQGELIPMSAALSLVRDLTPEPAPDDGQPAPNDERWWEFFWEHWPRKTAKKEARVAWDKAIRRGVHPLVMLKGLADQRAALTRQGKFCLYPAKWINNDRWEDELEAIDPVDLRTWRGNPFANPAVVAAAESMSFGPAMFGAVR